MGAQLTEPQGGGDRLPRVTSDVVISDPLRRALEDGPSIMVLCAPRGFGKSSQVAAWIRTRTQARVRYIWQGLPTAPTNRMEFWSATYRALTGANPPTGHDPVASIYGVLEKTLQPTTLVLDNFGYVSDESVDNELDEMVHQFPRLRLVVMVRTERVISAIANARPDGIVLRMADLAIDVDGMLSMAADAGYRMTRPQAAEILESVAGWPAVVRGLLREGSRSRDGALVPDWQVVERYARVVLADSEMRQFLPVLGVLSSAEEFSPDLGRALLGQDHWNSHFPSVMRTGIIEAWLQDGHDRFCIRPRLRAAIQEVVRRHDPDAYRRHHRELAIWFDARNLVQPALTHAVEAGEWELAGRLMEDFWLELISDSPDLTRQMLGRVPDRVVRASATLLVMRDYILIVDAAARTREAFRTGQMDVEHAAEQENYRLTLSQTLQLRSRGEHEAFRQVIEEGGTGAHRTAWAKPVQEQMPELLLQWAITILLTSDAASAAYAFRQAYRWAREQGTTGAKREAVAGLALCLAILGHLNSAGQWVARLDEIPPGPAVAGLEGASAALVGELIASDRLDPSDGLDGGPMRSARELPGLAAVAHYISVGPVLNRGSAMEKKVALTRAERALAALTPGRHGARITDATARSVIVDLSIATNQLERAHRGLEGADHTQPWVVVARARVALFEGRPDVALSLTAGCGSISLTDIRHGLQAHLLRACAAMRVGRMAVAGDNVQEAVSLAEQSGMIRPFALVPRVDLLRLDAEFPHVIPKRIIAAVTALPQVFPKPRDQVRLSAREREVLQEMATGMPLSQVAQRLYVTENTVKSQVRSIYRKLGVHARRDAIGRATALGLLSAAEPGS